MVDQAVDRGERHRRLREPLIPGRERLITSNLVFFKWEQIFKDPMTTAAAIDRVVHHAVVFAFTRPRFGGEEAERRAAAAKAS